MDGLISVSSGHMLANQLCNHSPTGCMTFNKTSYFYSGETARGVLHLDLTGFAVVKELSLAASVLPLLSVCKSKSKVDLSLSCWGSTSAKLETRLGKGEIFGEHCFVQSFQ